MNIFISMKSRLISIPKTGLQSRRSDFESLLAHTNKIIAKTHLCIKVLAFLFCYKNSKKIFKKIIDIWRGIN
ncbi:hypothetical protein AM592_11570 [Bacillus gobiensis]|uniref:Uncharacterized protein n=1 Tax=Bacillus gobiensis TaxID=1441095 RepID=A0A0M4G9Q2_9BACI|nr:hypothetical protein AM592_11570 [Bacillus gobiensis]